MKTAIAIYTIILIGIFYLFVSAWQEYSKPHDIEIVTRGDMNEN